MKKEHEICSGCGEEIDPTVCECGDEIYYNNDTANSRGHDGHSPVPIGCICGFLKSEDKILSYEEWEKLGGEHPEQDN